MTDKATILKQAQKFLAKGQTDKAIELWIEFVEKNPDGIVYNTIGDLYLKRNDKKNAILWLHKAARFIRDEGFSLKALAIYKKVLNVDNTDPDALIALGELNEEKGLVPEAIRFYLASIDTLKKRGEKTKIQSIYNKILNLAPSNIPLRAKITEFFIKEGFKKDASKELAYIARLYEEKGDSKTAADHFNKALELYPQNKEAYLSMAKLYQTVGKKQESLSVLKKALSVFRNDAELKLQITDQLISNKEFDGAIEILKQIGENEPDNLTVKEQIANIHLLKGNKEKAWSIYSSILNELFMAKPPEQLIKILKDFSDTEPVDTGKALASLYKQTGDTEAAFQELVKVGTILKDSGMPEEAMDSLNEARQIKPESPEIDDLTTALKQEMGLEETPVDSGMEQEKSIDELMAEAEVLLRYGQTQQALSILDSVKSREPSNVELHKRLKAVYTELGDKELAVTECLILASLFEREGMFDKKDQVLSDAFDINPDDPRLAERAFAAPDPQAPASEEAAPENPLDAYTEELSEADFYSRQGLYSEALEIYSKIAELLPGNEEIRNKIEAIEQQMNSETAAAPTVEDTSPEITSGIEPADDIVDVTEFDEPSALQLAEGDMESEAELPDGSFESIALDDPESLNPEEMPEPTLENDVLEIFEEFKKGIESELEEGDSETHYNLGIAYKEMGLVDDAIKEFQTANKDPQRLIQASSMLGICYMEKGLFPLAIDALKNAFAHIKEKDHSYWGTKFDLAEAYHKNGNIKEAFELFSEVYSFDSKFRNVGEKMNALKMNIKEVKAALSQSAPVHTEQKKKKDRISYL